MAASIRPVRVNHMNVVLESFEASVAHFERAYGAAFMVDMPQKEMHAWLFEMGRVIFEGFVPHEYLLNARYGPHYIGVEYLANMDEVRRAVADHGLRIVRDIGLALHTHPADSFGIAFEFYDGAFHDRHWDLLGGPIKPAEYWRDEHALGLTGLKSYTVAVEDIAAAQAFFQSFLCAGPLYDEARPAAAARAVGLRVADAAVELLTPTGQGAIADHLYRHGEGIRSTVFGVRSLDQAQRYLQERGLPVREGAAPRSILVPAEANAGVIFEFAE